MYATCLFCNHALGANGVLEDFPVGRRLAFDGATGRLWVVCRACERWNLSPLEERWEVIEECERLFSDTRMRVSTENIGLARLSGGLELVRIGKPMRPEFAAWRYGDQFGRRRRRMFVRVGAIVGGLGLVMAGAAAAGVAIGGFVQVGGNVIRPIVYGTGRKVVARIATPSGRIDVKRSHLGKVMLLSAGDDWRLEVPDGRRQKIVLAGDDARRAAALLLPPINVTGGTRRQVSEAVTMLERAPDDFGFVRGLAQGKNLPALPPSVRLALEMATHEEAERRALEGELKALEIAWKEADEVAAISDDLFLPKSVHDAIERIRRNL